MFISRFLGFFLLAAFYLNSGEAFAVSHSQTKKAVDTRRMVLGGVPLNFTYTHREMLEFDIYKHLEEHAPHLLPHAEVISHYAGLEEISPRLLLAMMEQQSRAFTMGTKHLQKPFGRLSSKTGFKEQLKDLTKKIRNARYVKNGSGTNYSNPRETLGSVMDASEIDGIGVIYRRMFPESEIRALGKTAEKETAVLDLGMQLPYAIGVSMTFNGAHTNSGTGDYPLNCLDFSHWERWEEEIPDDVVASHDGIFVQHSSCYARVILNETWSTTYYHMDEIQFNTNDSVQQNQPIGKYASNKEQALCDGGHSTGPHVHWCLRNERDPYHLENVVLSGWTIHVGDSSYYRNCDLMYMEKDGEKKCTFRALENGGVPKEVIQKNVKDLAPPVLTADLHAKKLIINTKGRHWLNLLDMNGTVKRTEKGGDRTIYDISNLSPGIYMAKVFALGKIHVRKLVVF